MNSAITIASAVRDGHITAVEVTDTCLAALENAGRSLVAVTRLLGDRARHEAGAVDAAIAAGRDPGPLAGVPYGVKDLFDVEGLPTTAGSSRYADAAPAAGNAETITRLREAGAVLVATFSMDEFALGFATINARHGTTRNPHDPDRLAGGSSGGSAAVVAAELLPFSLGSDTNGSVRVPASLTGIYGLKPTHEALPMGGAFPFADSFDDVGPFALSVADMQCVWNVLTGTAVVASDDEIRLARLGGRFRDNGDPDQIAAIDRIAPDAPPFDLPDIARAVGRLPDHRSRRRRAASRRARARCDAMAFAPATRDRLLAGALLPETPNAAAQEFCARYKQMIVELIADHDVLLAPATPCVAPMIAAPRILIDAALAVPLRRPGRMPLGLQLKGRPGDEATLFRFAATLAKKGLIGASSPAEAFQGKVAWRK